MTELQTRLLRAMWTLAAICAVLATGGLVGLDKAVANWVATIPGEGGILYDGVALLDLATLKSNSTFLLGIILLMVAAGLLVLRSMRPMGWTMLYIGSVQFVSTVTADLAKPQFGRFRPSEALADPGGTDLWFVGGNSFPSGHTAFYAGLFFPLMLVFPLVAAVHDRAAVRCGTKDRLQRPLSERHQRLIHACRAHHRRFGRYPPQGAVKNIFPRTLGPRRAGPAPGA